MAELWSPYEVLDLHPYDRIFQCSGLTKMGQRCKNHVTYGKANSAFILSSMAATRSTSQRILRDMLPQLAQWTLCRRWHMASQKREVIQRWIQKIEEHNAEMEARVGRHSQHSSSSSGSSPNSSSGYPGPSTPTRPPRSSSSGRLSSTLNHLQHFNIDSDRESDRGFPAILTPPSTPSHSSRSSQASDSSATMMTPTASTRSSNRSGTVVGVTASRISSNSSATLVPSTPPHTPPYRSASPSAPSVPRTPTQQVQHHEQSQTSIPAHEETLVMTVQRFQNAGLEVPSLTVTTTTTTTTMTAITASPSGRPEPATQTDNAQDTPAPAQAHNNTRTQIQAPTTPATSSPANITRDSETPTRRAIDDDCCPICFDPITNLDNAVWCRAQCGKNVHRACFGEWRRCKLADFRAGEQAQMGGIVQGNVDNNADEDEHAHENDSDGDDDDPESAEYSARAERRKRCITCVVCRSVWKSEYE